MKSLWEIYAPYRERVLWTALFVIIGILFLTIGIWRTLLLAALGAIGYCIGYRGDEPERFSEIVDTISEKLKKR